MATRRTGTSARRWHCNARTTSRRVGGPSDPAETITSVLLRGQFYVRLEHDQWRFARERARAYDAAIIPARYCAPYPVTHPSAGQDHLRLATAVTEARRPLVVEPDTAPMLATGIARYDSAARLRATAAASVVELPLTVEQLRSAQRRDVFVDASMQDQRLARAVAPPHLDFRSANDERLTLNLLMVRRVVTAAAAQMPVAFIQVTRAVLMRGVLRDVARRYAATGVQRVFIRVRGVGEDASADELAAYLDAIEAFTECSVDVVADCVGASDRCSSMVGHSGSRPAACSSAALRRRCSPRAVGAGGRPFRLSMPGATWSAVATPSPILRRVPWSAVG